MGEEVIHRSVATQGAITLINKQRGNPRRVGVNYKPVDSGEVEYFKRDRCSQGDAWQRVFAALETLPRTGIPNFISL